jgi:hypothetical protein
MSTNAPTGTGGDRFATNIGQRARKAEFLLALLRQERESTVDVRWRKRIGLWRRGFLGSSHVTYQLERRDPRDFVTDYQLFMRTPFINGAFAPVLDNKLIFQRVIATHLSFFPAVWGVVTDGRATFLGGVARHDPVQFIDDLLERHHRLVLKPVTADSGQVLHVLDKQSGALRVDGSLVEKEVLARWLAPPASFLVGEFIEQHPVMGAPFHDTVNALRILTMQDPDDDPFVAAAVLGIGRPSSVPVDSWARGGLCASVDVETGTVGPACSYPARSDRLTWYDSHPETGMPIEGLELPHWNLIVDQLMQLLRSATYLHHVGWHVAITPDGFKILDGDSHPDLTLFQLHGPLLANPRVRAFYRRHRVIPK